MSTHRVIALEQRGHGCSERMPTDVSRGSYVDDIAHWIAALDLEKPIVVGQSLGGHTAFLLAARYPSMVRTLVVAEASPAANRDGAEAAIRWLKTWPQPFADRLEALTFFGGHSMWAAAWTDALESRREGGLWPAFEIDVMARSLEEAAALSFWHEWSQISCPTPIVRAERGVPLQTARRMASELQDARLETIAKATHDIHLEQPGKWRAVLKPLFARGLVIAIAARLHRPYAGPRR